MPYYRSIPRFSIEKGLAGWERHSRILGNEFREIKKETQSMNAGRCQTLMDINFSLDLGDAVRKEQMNFEDSYKSTAIAKRPTDGAAEETSKLCQPFQRVNFRNIKKGATQYFSLGGYWIYISKSRPEFYVATARRASGKSSTRHMEGTRNVLKIPSFRPGVRRFDASMPTSNEGDPSLSLGRRANRPLKWMGLQMGMHT
jgi:hypothetical protein